VAGEANVDVVILLSDVEGLYEKPPTSGSSGKKRDVIDTYFPDAKFTIGTRSGTGTSYTSLGHYWFTVCPANQSKSIKAEVGCRPR